MGRTIVLVILGIAGFFVVLTLFLASMFAYMISRIMSILLSGSCLLYPIVMAISSGSMSAGNIVGTMEIAAIIYPIAVGLSVLYALGPWLTGGTYEFSWGFDFISGAYEPLFEDIPHISIATAVTAIVMVVITLLELMWVSLVILILVLLFDILSLIFRDTMEP